MPRKPLPPASLTTSNFFLNNEITYRDRRLKSWSILWGFVAFCAFCSLGALANIDIASQLFHTRHEVWWVAGAAGALPGVLWNYAMSSRFVGVRDDGGDAADRSAGRALRLARDRRRVSAALGRRGLLLAVVAPSGRRVFRPPAGNRLAELRGTPIFGQTEFGVRAGGILLSFVASAFVWRTGAILSGEEKTGALACLFFNLTAMATVESLAATPDAPELAAAAAFFFCLAKIAETGNGRWWLMAGLCAGLGLLSKYTALFLGVGAFAWLIASKPMRRWLISPWPYLGGVLALAVFAPNLLWNAHHGWATFAFHWLR